MGWKGAIRSINAAAKRSSRELEKRQRAQAREQKIAEKFNSAQLAQNEVEQFNRYINQIQSIHKITPKKINWQNIAGTRAPSCPEPTFDSEKKALKALKNFKPNFLHKLLKRTEKAKSNLEKKVNIAKEQDLIKNQEKQSQYLQECKTWKEETDFARKVLSLEIGAVCEVLQKFSAFKNNPDINTNMKLSITAKKELIIDLKLPCKEKIPNEVKTFLQSGSVDTLHSTFAFL